VRLPPRGRNDVLDHICSMDRRVGQDIARLHYLPGDGVNIKPTSGPVVERRAICGAAHESREAIFFIDEIHA
jgi:Holliday junction resolvasome RuvABC ATP-dependent DNA helicase subunit